MNLDKILAEHSKWLSDKTTGKRASLEGANLRGADLTRASLEGANLRGASLRGASLEGASLEGANLRGADLTRASLEGANLRGADLTRASLRGANLRYANLYGASLRYADLTRAKGIIQWQSPQGEKRICYSVKHDSCVMHQLGCFWGNTDEAMTAIQEKYGENSLYEKFLLMQVEALECEE